MVGDEAYNKAQPNGDHFVHFCSATDCRSAAALSSNVGNPRAAAESLYVLLDEALRILLASLHSCMPVAVTGHSRIVSAMSTGEYRDIECGRGTFDECISVHIAKLRCN